MSEELKETKVTAPKKAPAKKAPAKKAPAKKTAEPKATKKVDTINPPVVNGRTVILSKHPQTKKLAKGSKPYETKGKIEITLTKSVNGCVDSVKETVAALGLRKIGQSKVVGDNPAIRGMIFKVKHMVSVKEVK